MNSLKVQGVVFSVSALLVAAACFLFPRLDPQIELFVFLALVVVLGVPHGALDPIFARRLYAVHSFAGWLAFVALYVGLGISVIVFWVLAPSWFLVAFLIASAAHFSGDPVPGTHWVARVLYGGSVIVLPVLLHANDMTQLFSFLVGAAAADSFVSTLLFLAWPWVTGILLVLLFTWRRNRLTALEIASSSLLAIAAPPLLGFAVFFCAMHSSRHSLRTKHYAGLPTRQLLLTSVVPTVAVVAAGMLTWTFVNRAPLDMRIVQFVVIGLAALTAPHMLLVERVRFSGWAKPGSS